MEEIWKTAVYIKEDGSIEIYENYEVSNIGRVKSLNYNHTSKEKILRPGNNNSDHLHIRLYKNNKVYDRSIHRLVLSSFDPEGWFPEAVVDHIDSNPRNNRLDNLRWVTQKENASTEHRRRAQSKATKGSKCYKAQPCVYNNKEFGCIKDAYEYAREHGYIKRYEAFRKMIKKGEN